MAIYAIGDLHFPGGQDKPMNVFGSHWDDHAAQIAALWEQTVQSEDLVLIPGDISWAMDFDQAKADLRTIAEFPGEKLLLRGNHDYWWSSIGRIRDWLPPNMHALQNDAFRWQDTAICGTRGWTFPTAQNPLDGQEQKIYNRELIRLELSLQQASGYKLQLIAMLHYPPLLKDTLNTAFTDLLENYGVSLCCFGHLHDVGIQNAFQGKRNGVDYHLVSCDAIGFAPKLLIP
jgi:uncharacterized protein